MASMDMYLDGFAFPIKKAHLETYKAVAHQVAQIWNEHGALSYQEYVGDDLQLEGTRSFVDVLELTTDEIAIFGWVMFPSKAIRDQANASVPKDPRMEELVAPLMNPKQPIFEPSRMIFGGFSPLVKV